jgi:hypothetical protein
LAGARFELETCLLSGLPKIALLIMLTTKTAQLTQDHIISWRGPHPLCAGICHHNQLFCSNNFILLKIFWGEIIV